MKLLCGCQPQSGAGHGNMYVRPQIIPIAAGLSMACRRAFSQVANEA